MDLSGQGTIKTVWEKDDITGLVTVTFKDSTEAVILGTITLEQNKFRSMMDALGEVGRYYFPDTLPGRVKHRTVFENSTNKAATTFG